VTNKVTDELLQMGERQFYAVVDDDIRGKAPQLYAAGLRTPEVIERWFQTLIRMQTSVEGTIAARATDDKAKRIPLIDAGRIQEANEMYAAFLKQKSGSLRFLTGVKEVLTEASWRRRVLLGTQLQTTAIYERNVLITETQKLRAAISAHKAKVSEDPEYDSSDPDEIDSELWSVLESNAS
jgi:hypothetical protein